MAIRRATPQHRNRILQRRMTEQDYLRLPETKPYLEFTDGVVSEKPMPDDIHGRIVGEFDGRFWLYRRERGGDFGPERRVRLRPGLHQIPDTAYWAAGRPSGPGSAPSVVVEVLSPDDTVSEARAKCRRYRQFGVDVVWLVNPLARIAEVFTADDDGVVLDERTGVLSAACMPGFALPLGELFARQAE